jgi:hypothetical protein
MTGGRDHSGADARKASKACAAAGREAILAATRISVSAIRTLVAASMGSASRLARSLGMPLLTNRVMVMYLGRP